MPPADPPEPPPGWSLPTFPRDPADSPVAGDGEQTVGVVDDPFLTAVRVGELRTLDTPTRWMTGAVHDAEGALVAASQKIGGLQGHQGAQADPRRVRPRADAERLAGTWLYGGHWIHHFGHFFPETLTTLWPRREQLEAEHGPVAGLVFHRYFGRRGPVADWQRDLLGHVGWGDLPVVVVDREPRRADRVLVPTRAVVVNGWALPGAREVWERVVDAIGEASGPASPSGRVFFSRTAFNDGLRAAGEPTRTSAERDRALDRAFAAAGFAVVAPESLPIPEQVRLAAGAEVLAGSAGTALHLSAFAPAGVRVVELGDERSPRVKVPMQRVIDTVCRHPSAFVPHDVAPEDLPDVLRSLRLR